MWSLIRIIETTSTRSVKGMEVWETRFEVANGSIHQSFNILHYTKKPKSAEIDDAIGRHLDVMNRPRAVIADLLMDNKSSLDDAIMRARQKGKTDSEILAALATSLERV